MNQQLMKKIKKMQEEMVTTQKKIEETIFTASAGGIVEVDVLGTKQIDAINVTEDFEVESAEDIKMLCDSIVAASQKAYKEIDKITEEKMGKYNAMLGGGLF